MTLPRSPITPIPNTNPDAVPSLWNERYLEIDENFENHENRIAASEAELSAARGGAESLAERVDIIETITGTLEQTSAVSVQEAVSLDWLYRGSGRIMFELWKPGFTMIDVEDVALVGGIAGDDSIDVEDTSDLEAGAYYIVNDTNGKLLVQCEAVLSGNRIRISEDLPYSLGAGVLTRCTMDYGIKGYADCVDGDIWVSKIINAGTDEDGCAVIIRRSLNSAGCRLYYMDSYSPSWGESVWSLRRQGGDIPDGFADYEYVVPVRGDAQLRVETEGEDVTINHIVVVSNATDIGGYVNPAMKPVTPVISEPADEATGVNAEPTLSISIYSSPGNSAQAGIQFQLSKAEAFTSICHDTGMLDGARLSYQLSAGALEEGTTYYLRARVKDVAGLISDWSVVTSFATMETFAYIATPSIVSPTNNSTDIMEQPLLQTNAFSAVGDTDTHAASQWQIRTAAGTWASPAWDSTEDAVNLTSIQVPAGILQEGQRQYYIRARHKGTALGWSNYSSEIRITTKDAFANIIGVACTATGGGGGTWANVDEDGATVSPGESYFNNHPVFGGIEGATIDGQAMIKIPKFYYKRGTISGGDNDGKEAWWISDQLVDGFVIHPAFRSGGNDIDQIYVGKYQASYDGVSKLQSIAGVMPLENTYPADYRTYAAARNTGGVAGFMVWSFYHLAAIQYLYLIENATMNSQTKTGAGRTSSSSVDDVDDPIVAQATYRGIVGLWGNVWQYVDGFEKPDGNTASEMRVWDRNGNQTWVDTGIATVFHNTVGYPIIFADDSGEGFAFKDVFFPETRATTISTSTAPDLARSTVSVLGLSSVLHPVVGGQYNSGTDAGLWSILLCRTTEAEGMGKGTRLAKV